MQENEQHHPQHNPPTHHHIPVPEDSVGKKIWLFLMDTAQTILFAGGIFLVIYIGLFRPFQVSGDSMYSTFENREYILTNIIGMRFGDPERGDIVVFNSPTDQNKDFIKRVIAVPGDTVFLKDGFVYVNDKKVDEQAYLDKGIKTYGGTYMKEDVKVTLKKDEYMVMGDNRTNSSDSREWGVLSKDSIIGKAMLVYWPLDHTRIIDNPFKK